MINKVTTFDGSVTNNAAKDVALDYLEKHEEAWSHSTGLDPGIMKSIRRRVDLRMMPFLCASFALNFIDKVILNYAQVMGLPAQLKLKGNDYTNVSSAFFIAALIASLPNVWLLNRVSVSRWLGICLVGWGITTACHAALHDYHGLLAARIVSGICEAAVTPALMLLSSQYYTRREQAPRYAYWYMGFGLGQIIGSLISYGFQFVSPKASLSSWRIMFLVIGLITALFGIATYFLVPSNPMQATFLTEEEKTMLIQHIKVDQIGMENRHFLSQQLGEGLLDIQAWGLLSMLLLQTAGAGVTTSYSATLLRGYGYSPRASTLLNVPSGVINVVFVLSSAALVRHYGNRWLVNVVCGLLAWTGAALLTFLPNSKREGLLTGLYLINCLPAATIITYHWLAVNTAGHTKRAYVAAGANAAFAIGNIIAPQTFQARDAPAYRPAKITLMAFWMASVVVAVVLFIYYRFVNKARDRTQPAADEDVDVKQAFKNLTDRQNLSFRYQY